MSSEILFEEGVEEQARKMREIKVWMEERESLKGRADGDFLLMFLRSCEFDVEFTKRTIELYYENRINQPEWWVNRDLNQPEMQQVLSQRIFTALKDNHPEQPVVTIFQLNRVGSNSGLFDNIVKVASVMQDVIARRQHCQLHGHTCIVDLANAPWWFSFKVLSPVLVKKYCNSFLYSIPIRLNKVVYLNAPYTFSAFLRFLQPFLGPQHKNKMFSFGSDWSKLGNIIPLEVLPEEYGGFNGPLKEHEDMFRKEMMGFNEYLVEDGKYGFQENYM